MKASLFYVAGLAAIASATPLASVEPVISEDGLSYKISPLEARQASPCQVISNLVSLLSASQATPFCSEFLSIGTQTVSESFTDTATDSITNTITEVVTTTIVDRTSTITFSETTTIATVPTVVSTSVTVSTSISTVTTTPATVTVTTTSWTIPAAKRSAAPELDKRAVSIPGYLRPFASAAISKGCSCLNIPSPTVTVSTTATETVTQTDSTTRTNTFTTGIPTSVSITLTQSVTYTSPVTTTSTSVTVSRVTVTAATPTTTVTAFASTRPECRNLKTGAGGLYTQGGPGRNIASDATSWINDGSNNSWTECCERCWLRGNCSVFFNSQSTGGTRRCFFYVNTEQVNQNINGFCSLGRLTTATQSGQNPNSGFGLGACWKVW